MPWSGLFQFVMRAPRPKATEPRATAARRDFAPPRSEWHTAASQCLLFMAGVLGIFALENLLQWRCPHAGLRGAQLIRRDNG